MRNRDGERRKVDKDRRKENIKRKQEKGRLRVRRGEKGSREIWRGIEREEKRRQKRR